MKRSIRFILITVICFILFAAVSCSNSEDSLDDYKQVLESASKEDETQQPDPFAEKLYVIIPRKCSGELSVKALDLAKAIESKTGVTSAVKYDNERIDIGSKDVGVLLGATSYLQSQEAIKLLKHKDYICRWDGNFIVLGGRHDDATVKATERFMTEVIHGASAYSLMAKEAGFESITKYELSGVTLNDFDLYDYTFVYSGESDGVEKECAKVLREYIAKRSGYFLNIISEDELDDTVGKVIYFAKNDKMVGATMDVVDKSIYIEATGKYELSVATAELARLLFANVKDGASKASVSACTISCRGQTLNVCRAFSMCPEQKNLDFVADWASRIQTAQHDIIIFDKVESWFLEHIECDKGEYSLILKTDSVGNTYPVLYRKSIFDSVSVDINESSITAKVKVVGEREERTIVCSITQKASDLKDKLKDHGRCDVFIIGGDVEEKLLTGDLSRVDEKVWSFEESDNKQNLVVGDFLNVEDGEMTLATSGGDSFINVFLSFSYRINVCEAFADLKDPAK